MIKPTYIYIYVSVSCRECLIFFCKCKYLVVHVCKYTWIHKAAIEIQRLWGATENPRPETEKKETPLQTSWIWAQCGRKPCDHSSLWSCRAVLDLYPNGNCLKSLFYHLWRLICLKWYYLLLKAMTYCNVLLYSVPCPNVVYYLFDRIIHFYVLWFSWF